MNPCPESRAEVVIALSDIFRADRIARQLARVGVPCESVFSGSELLAQLSRGGCRALLIDPEFEDLDCNNLLAWLRTNRTRPLVLVAGEREQVAERAGCLEMVTAFLPAPVEGIDLLEYLRPGAESKPEPSRAPAAGALRAEARRGS